MSSRWNPRISRSTGSGNVPVDVTDHFEATIVVGNTPNGDPAVAQTGAFRYIPDPGDGTGIATAIDEALLAGTPTRIRIRPGTYDLSVGLGAGSFSLPFALTGPIRLEGSGSPSGLAGTAPTLLTMGSSLAARSIFTVDSGAQLSDLLIILPGATAAASAGTSVVRASYSTTVERVNVRVVGGTAANDTLRNIFLLAADLGSGPQMTRLVDCTVIYTASGSQDLVYAFALEDGNTAPNEITGGIVYAGTLSALRLGAGTQKCRVRIQTQTTGNVGQLYGTGHDVEIVGSLSSGVNNFAANGPYNSKIRITGAVLGSSQVVDSDDSEWEINAPAHALVIGGDRSRISGVLGSLSLESANRYSVDGARITTNAGGSGNLTITSAPTFSQRCRVTGCAVEGTLTVAGNNNIAVGNSLSVIYVNTGTGNEFGHNVVA